MTGSTQLHVPALQGFVLAAGKGERLRPVTEHIPKPLLPVVGRPVLDRVLEKVLSAGAGRMGVNAHYLPGVIAEWIRGSAYAEQVRIFHEPVLLGTGGGIRTALEELCDEGDDLLVHNGDILSDIPLEAVVNHHREHRSLATLCVVNAPPTNRLVQDDEGFLSGLTAAPGSDGLTFTGIAVYSRSFVPFLPEGPSHVVDAWLKAIASGGKIGLVRMDGYHWTDMGTPEAYAAEVFRCLDVMGRRVFVGETVPCTDLDLRGRVVIEDGATVPTGTVLRDAIVLPGTKIEAGRRIERVILGQDCSVPLFDRRDTPREDLPGSLHAWRAFRGWQREAGADSDRLSVEQIGFGGSRRRFVRIEAAGNTVVACLSPPGDPETVRYRDVAKWLGKGGIGVPHVIASEVGAGHMLLEDLGDRSLFEWLNCRPEPSCVENVYGDVLRVAAKLHSLPLPEPAMPPGDLAFDHEYFMWESGYFIEQFVGRHVRSLCTDASDADLLRERKDLASVGAGQRQSVLHRDLQSQNIMLVGAELAPVLIDIQGARLGPAAYDVASLLWDPYAPMEDSLRQNLVARYVEERSEMDPVFDGAVFRESLLPCRIQRHMQALGAYGFLAGARRLERFGNFIPEGIRLLLEDVEAASPRWPELARLVRRCARELLPGTH